jgi:hypothetical protein
MNVVEDDAAEGNVVKRTVGRPRGGKAPHQPVLSTSARVPAEIYEKFVKAAEASGRTLSAEVIQRACQSFEWEAAHKTIEAMRAKAEHVTEETTKRALENELQRRDYRRVRGVNGAAWFEPGVDSINWIADPNLLEKLLERVATRAIEKLATRAIEKPRRKR